MNTIRQVIEHLEAWAPPVYQESYDNSGLLTGDASTALKGILVTLDCTEEVVDEAISKNCNLIVAHHPIIFSGIKKLNGKNYVERTVIKAIRNDICIYAIHTNLDNVAHGVNAKICEKLGLLHTKVLAPKSGVLYKMIVYVPEKYTASVQQAMFDAGAGQIGNYSECSFYADGTGTFKGNDQSNGFSGEKNIRHNEAENRLEVMVEQGVLNRVIAAMTAAHPYEEVAYDVVALGNKHAGVGSGMTGELPDAMDPREFLAFLREKMNLNVIRFTNFDKPVKKVAVCGGSGSFLLNHAIGAGADAYITGDFKYHEFFDAEKRLMIADIGHYESEIFTINLLSDEILKKFPTFAVILSQINTNPINYYY